ncbi:thiamine diphosphokinase [Ligilactobacillus sp. LYQ135]
MKFKVLTGGPNHLIPQNIFHEKQATWVGVDYGAVRLVEHGIEPFLVIGDFDSANKIELSEIEKKSQKLIYRPLKDDITDTELALRYLIKNYHSIDEIEIYGATGGRLDQLLANLLMILKPIYQDYVEKIKIVDQLNQVSFYLPGKHQVKKDKQMQYLAFIPLTKVDQLELPDEKYQLKATDFTFPISLSSNEFIGEKASFSFKTGIVMVVQSKD